MANPFLPHGTNKLSSEYMSVYIRFKSKVGEPRTNYSLSLLDYCSGEAVTQKRVTCKSSRALGMVGLFRFSWKGRFLKLQNALRQ